MSTDLISENIVETTSIIKTNDYVYKVVSNLMDNTFIIFRISNNRERIIWIPPLTQTLAVNNGELEWVPLLNNNPTRIEGLEKANGIIHNEINQFKEA